MSDLYGSVVWPSGAGDDLPDPDRIWTHGDFTPVQEFPLAELTAGYTSGAFLRAALRRRLRFWCAFAFAGLLIGLGLYVKFPPQYHATTTLLLTNPSGENAATEMQTEATLAQSLPVAESVMRQLGLPGTVASFMATCTVTVSTDQVLTITVGAPSASAAVARTNALATAFLQFRATYLGIQQQDLVTELNQQQAQAQKRLDAINTRIEQVSAEPSSPNQQASLKKLQTEELDASNALGQVKAYVVGTIAESKKTMDSIVQNSKVLNPATLAKYSRVKNATLDVAGGLIGGMALGIAIVVVGALVSDRLRRRDDVAEAFGAPVRLSVGPLRKSRGLMAISRQRARRDLDLRRVVAYLRSILPGSSRGPVGLAIVAVGDVQVASRVVASLAVTCANEGKKVIVADLSGSAGLARLLGVKGAGVHPVSREGASFVVTVPKPEDVAPVGPLPGSALPAVPAEADKALVAASNSADILLTLATLDPAFGSEYLATWATEAVAMVTAGHASEERIRGVRAMIRLAGIRLDSVVLVEADKRDQSLGVSRPWDAPASFGPV